MFPKELYLVIDMGRKSHRKCPDCKVPMVRLYQRILKENKRNWKPVGYLCAFCGNFFENFTERDKKIDELTEDKPLALMSQYSIKDPDKTEKTGD